ncbi:MAG TPA: VCBS repeat-containing protein [Vicinamibacterales bacterium]|nr:VCBS repeat-containing protein [Vicinamibacterales bacterium]
MLTPTRCLLAVGVVLGVAQSAPTIPTKLWTDATAATIGETKEWTNKVEIADLNGDGLPDLLFANGGGYSTPGKPEPSRVFFNMGAGKPFVDRTTGVFGEALFLSRSIKARDYTGDGIVDILVSTTYQTQSHLYVGTGKGAFRDATANLPQMPLSIGDVEPGDVDGDGDLDLVLTDWGPGDSMTNDGGRTRLWLNDGTGRFTDATEAKMPAILVRFSWDLELMDVDNDYDLDVAISCKRCNGSLLFRNDGAGTFANVAGIPAYTNNYEFEPMDLDGDGFLDLITINDGEIVDENSSSRREHVFRNNGRGRFVDATTKWWPNEANLGEDDNVAACLDFDSDGDADFVIGSLSGPSRLLINDGKGHLSLAKDVFVGPAAPGTLGLALADLDADGRPDVVIGQGENPQAVQERVFLGTGLKPDTAPPTITMVGAADAPGGGTLIRARVHDRKSPSLSTEWKSVTAQWTTTVNGVSTAVKAPMQWYGEYLWRVSVPASRTVESDLKVCATDAAGNSACK